MGRAARVSFSPAAHITSRSGAIISRMFSFANTDRDLYVALLRDQANKAGLRILGYCLMTNHIHLVTTPERPNSLAAGLGRVHNDYARWLHVRQGRTGHLWQNRFFSCPLSESHLAEVLRYVELNPSERSWCAKLPLRRRRHRAALVCCWPKNRKCVARPRIPLHAWEASRTGFEQHPRYTETPRSAQVTTLRP